MATAVRVPDLDVGMAFTTRAARSYSLASSFSEDNSFVSPPIPATPTNTPVTNLSTPAALSPVCFPPQNTPVTNVNSPAVSGTVSPIDMTSPIVKAANSESPDPLQKLPALLEAQQCDTPMLGPTVPPNSPEYGATEASLAEIHDGHANLGERLAALGLGDLQPIAEETPEAMEEVIKAPENEFYEIRKAPGKGYGCFAIKPIKRGTRILADSCLLSVKKAWYLHADIQAEYNKLSPAEKVLYLSLHSAHNQSPDKWPKAIHALVPERERERIQEQHAARTGKEATLISIFQTNCMEKEEGAGVFPNAARFNHSCNPNACFTWNPAIEKETIHTNRDIQKGEELTLSYCDITHDTATRRWELNHYGFACDCPACGEGSDPESLAAKSAERRYRMYELEQQLKPFRSQNLEQGVQQEGFISKLLELATLYNAEGEYTARLSTIYLDIALTCEYAGDFRFAKAAADKALQVRIDCHGEDYIDVQKYRLASKRIDDKFAISKRMNGTAE